jgi:predicted DNA repair protein MutK
MKTQSKEPIQPILAIGGGKFYLNFNIGQKQDEEHGEYYEADTVEVSDTNYDTLVEALIRTRYSLSNEIAMINNRIAFPADTDKTAEFEAYQAWRIMAKETAVNALNAFRI